MIKTACLLLLASAIAASAQQTDAHRDGVVARGDHVMGFSHEKTVHHFHLTRNGGIIEALVSNSADTQSREDIRAHFEHIASMFADGDFDAPMLIHDRVPPGVPIMKKLRKQISYRVLETPSGSRILISSDSQEAVNAIHAFLRFQIQEHQTGDATRVAD